MILLSTYYSILMKDCSSSDILSQHNSPLNETEEDDDYDDYDKSGKRPPSALHAQVSFV